MPARHITIVEDDTEVSRLTKMLFESEGYAVSQVFRGDEAVEHVKSTQPDAVILDIMLPGMDGIQVCEALRDVYSGPILMLTGSDDSISEITSFRKGADDYVVKPFVPSVLVARIEALLRRSRASQTSDDMVATANLVIHFARREAQLSGQILNLTTSEFDLLSLLAKHVGETVTREQCSDSLRGLQYDGLDRSIDMKVSALRKKLNPSSQKNDLIKTVRGRGYMLIKAPASDSDV